MRKVISTHERSAAFSLHISKSNARSQNNHNGFAISHFACDVFYTTVRYSFIDDENEQVYDNTTHSLLSVRFFQRFVWKIEGLVKNGQTSR